MEKHHHLSFKQAEASILDRFSVFLHWFEVGLAAVCVVFVGIGAVFLLSEAGHFEMSIVQAGLHHSFEELLSDVLLLVVGIELAIMLIRRTPESLVEVMFFVIARKMLIKTDHVVELLIGVAALGGLFAIRKYLEHLPPARQRVKSSLFKRRERDARAAAKAAAAGGSAAPAPAHAKVELPVGAASHA